MRWFCESIWNNKRSLLVYWEIVTFICLQIIGNYTRWTCITLMHKVLNINPVDEHINSLIKQFFDKCLDIHNTLINNIGNYSISEASAFINFQSRNYYWRHLFTCRVWRCLVKCECEYNIYRTLGFYYIFSQNN